MITLTGILRQAGEVKIKEKPLLKLVVEHETARDSGVNDLHLETLFVPPHDPAKLPKQGEWVSVEVRPYPSGKGIAYAAVRLILGESADPVAA